MIFLESAPRSKLSITSFIHRSVVTWKSKIPFRINWKSMHLACSSADFSSFLSLWFIKCLHNDQYQYISWCYTSIFTIIENLIDVNLVNDKYVWFSLLHFLIFLLKIPRDSESIKYFGKMSHIFGAKKETVSVAYLTEFAFRLVKSYSLVKCNCCFFAQKFHS